MLFKEIVAKIDWSVTKEKFLGFYPDIEENIAKFGAILATLKSLKPKQPTENIVLRIEHITEDYRKQPVDYNETTGYEIEEDRHYGIAFMHWENWLALEVYEKTLTNYSSEDILIHALWEMTYYGFSPEEINDSRAGLDNRITNIDEFEKISLSNGLEIHIPKELFFEDEERIKEFISALELLTSDEEELLKLLGEKKEVL